MARTLSVVCAVLSTAAWADAVDVALANTQVLRGKGWPEVKVSILEPIAGFKLTLTRGDGKKFEWKGGGKPGVVRTIVLDQPLGKVTWAGELLVNFPNATTTSIPLEFETLMALPLELKIDKDKDVDIAKRSITFRLNNPAGKAELKVMLESGDYVFNGEIPFAGEPAGTPLKVTWPDARGERPMKISLRAFDTANTYQGIEFFPWSFEIPHEDVTFDTGKWDIKPEEQKKLDDASQKALDAIAKFGKWAPVNLYVVGHTDTVGDTGSNRALSLNRARSIASYFKRRGISIPVKYEGFGEEALAVATDDEVDEVRNRRAQYIISIDPPRVTNSSFRPTWQRL
jgi:outer membrane protein OmpA-like peptidoglycan-associated protein